MTSMSHRQPKRPAMRRKRQQPRHQLKQPTAHDTAVWETALHKRSQSCHHGGPCTSASQARCHAKNSAILQLNPNTKRRSQFSLACSQGRRQHEEPVELMTWHGMMRTSRNTAARGGQRRRTHTKRQRRTDVRGMFSLSTYIRTYIHTYTHKHTLYTGSVNFRLTS